MNTNEKDSNEVVDIPDNVDNPESVANEIEDKKEVEEVKNDIEKDDTNKVNNEEKNGRDSYISNRSSVISKKYSLDDINKNQSNKSNSSETNEGSDYQNIETDDDSSTSLLDKGKGVARDEIKEESIAENVEIKGEFHSLFNKSLNESEDVRELKRTLSNLYDKIKQLSRDNINHVEIIDKEPDYINEVIPLNEDHMEVGGDLSDLNKYYQSFSGTLQRFKPMATPSPELCATINNRYQNNINIQEFFERLEKITNQNAYAINNSLSSLVNLMHGTNSSFSGSTPELSNASRDRLDYSRGNSLRHPKKTLNPGEAGLNKNYRSYFKFAKKKFNHNNQVFVSNITTDTIPIPKITVPSLPPVEELPLRDPLSLGIYYHNHKQYDIADYYFTLSSVDNNPIGLYIHGMYLKYGHGISGCSPELGFQYLLKSAEASIQSIPTVNKNITRMASTLGLIDENEVKLKNKKKGKEINGSHSDFLKLYKVQFNDEKKEPDEIVAEKMLMKTNIANILTNLTDEEFETWIVRCIVSLPIY